MGRKHSFVVGLMVALFSCLMCAYAAYSGNFWLLVTSTAVAGYYSANAQLYRFAATELAAPAYREKAVSLVLAGGLLGAVLGPNLATMTRDVFPVAFVGAYIALGVVAVFAIGVIGLIQFPPLPPKKRGPSGRPMRTIIRQPVFIVSAGIGALSYGVMNLLMAATPIAMQICGHPFAATAWVLQWHVIGMFAPGFVTGHLIKRFGSVPVMAAGVFLNLICVAVALAGDTVPHFLISMFLVGVGWNFMFTGSTALALQAYQPEEKNKVQAANNFCVFAMMACSSFSSGALVTTRGWDLLNYGSLVLMLIAAVALVWYAFFVRHADYPAPIKA